MPRASVATARAAYARRRCSVRNANLMSNPACTPPLRSEVAVRQCEVLLGWQAVEVRGAARILQRKIVQGKAVTPLADWVPAAHLLAATWSPLGGGAVAARW